MATIGFPSTKIGGSWKVSKKVLNEWLEHSRWHEIELDRQNIADKVVSTAVSKTVNGSSCHSASRRRRRGSRDTVR